MPASKRCAASSPRKPVKKMATAKTKTRSEPKPGQQQHQKGGNRGVAMGKIETPQKAKITLKQMMITASQAQATQPSQPSPSQSPLTPRESEQAGQLPSLLTSPAPMVQVWAGTNGP